jgi:hypothetical protein
MVGGTSARGKGHVAVNGRGEDPAVVVVDVLAEEVDSARSLRYMGRRPAKVRSEGAEKRFG